MNDSTLLTVLLTVGAAVLAFLGFQTDAKYRGMSFFASIIIFVSVAVFSSGTGLEITDLSRRYIGDPFLRMIGQEPKPRTLLDITDQELELRGRQAKELQIFLDEQRKRQQRIEKQALDAIRQEQIVTQRRIEIAIEEEAQRVRQAEEFENRNRAALIARRKAEQEAAQKRSERSGSSSLIKNGFR